MWGALLPDGFALSEWQVVSKSAVPSPIGERGILVECCPKLPTKLIKWEPNRCSKSEDFSMFGRRWLKVDTPYKILK
jgi:hypothetical protein